MKMIMALAVAMLLAGCFPAVAEEDGLSISILHQLSADDADCVAYHMLFKQCAPEDATEPQLTQMQGMVEKA